MKALRFLSALILIAGAGLTGRAVYLHAKAKLAGFLIRRAWEQTAQTGKPRPPWPWADAHPVARLRIPRLGYDEIVLDDATPRTLAFGPALLLSGALIGEPGNVVLAGHRDTWFLRLEKILAGDTIQVEWFDARRGGLYERKYKVSEIQVVDPSDAGLLGPTPDDALTLLTCYPFGRSPHSPQRYVIRAKPLGPSHLARSDTRRSREKSLRVCRSEPVINTNDGGAPPDSASVDTSLGQKYTRR
jgi:sortase A